MNLIRDKIQLEKNDIVYREEDKDKINNFFIKKVKEELNEIIESKFNDVYEFADLLQVVEDFAKFNSIDSKFLNNIKDKKFNIKGGFTNLILNYKK